jgi:hypothetical protein
VFPTRVRGAAWWPHTPAWMSRMSSLPSGIGMRRCKIPEGLRLYNSSSIMWNDLAFLAMRRALVRSEGSSPQMIQAMYWLRQSRVDGASSISIISPSSAEDIS